MTNKIQNQAQESSKANDQHQKMEVINAKRFRPDDFIEIAREDDLGIIVWSSPVDNSTIGYKGRALKNSFYINFRSKERQAEFVESFIGNLKKRALENEQIRIERKNKKRELEVGDILVCSWGYEQTNVDYYQVVSLVGKSSVEIKRVKGEKTRDSRGDAGSCVPVVDSFFGESITKKVTNGVNVSIDNYMTARKKNFDLVDGVKQFRPDFWSSYA